MEALWRRRLMMIPAFEQRSLEYRSYIETYLADYLKRFHEEPQQPLYDAIRENPRFRAVEHRFETGPRNLRKRDENDFAWVK
jgi:hypothetical protein